MRQHQSVLALLIAMLLPMLAAAADAPKRIKYVPPPGFAGHKWGDLRATFPRLSDTPFSSGAAWMMPVITDFWLTCGVNCDANNWQASMMERREGGGFYVLSEYQVDGQGFQWGDDARVQFFPVTYQFCANWWSMKKVKPADFDELNKFCGVKLTFQSETADELAKLPPDRITTYDLVLDRLLAKFGRPDSFVRRGTVVIESTEPESDPARPTRKFRTYRWCPAFDRRFHTSCVASVVLTIEPDTGVGHVLYSAPTLWEYAYARKNNGHKNEALFKVLHARR